MISKKARSSVRIAAKEHVIPPSSTPASKVVAKQPRGRGRGISTSLSSEPVVATGARGSVDPVGRSRGRGSRGRGAKQSSLVAHYAGDNSDDSAADEKDAHKADYTNDKYYFRSPKR